MYKHVHVCFIACIVMLINNDKCIQFTIVIIYSELCFLASLSSSDGLDPILTDIYNNFNCTLETFKTSATVKAHTVYMHMYANYCMTCIRDCVFLLTTLYLFTYTHVHVHVHVHV